MAISIAIIEDQDEIRNMLTILLNGSEGFSCIASYSNAEEAIAEIPKIKPDVVLVDIHLPGQSGIACINTLKPLCAETQFMIRTSLEDTDTIFEALKAGANGYIVKSTSPSKLLDAIVEVYHGGSPMSSQIARKVVSSFQNNESKKNKTEVALLSKRENEILQFLSKGLRYKEIADKLFLSTETIRTHIRNIYEKLQVNSRTDALNKVFGSKGNP
ncbi:MAG: response regulator transcription factor [Bacteroidetes bacterium]|jgi:DNA-binding NarL/FixJ family response regulator|nr:response regulator transcription factor [Bacteroidota bacterium]